MLLAVLTDINRQDMELSGWEGYKTSSLLAYPLKDDGGKVVGILSLHDRQGGNFTVQDREVGAVLASYCGEALRAAIAVNRLKESENRFRLLAENSSDVIWIMTLDNRFTYISPAIFHVIGYTPEEVLQLTLEDIMTVESYKTIMQIIGTELQKPVDERKPSITLDMEMKCRSGEIRQVEISASWAHDVNGDLIGVQGVTRDVTHRRREQEEKVRLEMQLLQSQKMEVIGRLAGGVAHDLNNMLSPILGYTEMLMMDTSDDDVKREDLTQIQTCCNQSQGFDQAASGVQSQTGSEGENRAFE